MTVYEFFRIIFLRTDTEKIVIIVTWKKMLLRLPIFAQNGPNKIPYSNYMFKVNNRNTRTRCE